jgi:hypothetical protein
MLIMATFSAVINSFTFYLGFNEKLSCLKIIGMLV